MVNINFLKMASPGRTADYRKKVADTRKYLEACWKVDIDWNLYPEYITTVRFCSPTISLCFK